MQAKDPRSFISNRFVTVMAPGSIGFFGLPAASMVNHVIVASFLALVVSLLVIPNLKTFLAGSLCAAMLAIQMYQSAKINLRNIIPQMSRTSLVICLMLAAFMLAATLSTIVQVFRDGGVGKTIIYGLANPILAVTCLIACLAVSHQSPIHGLLLLAMMVAFICIGNHIADVLGIGSEFLKSREAFWASRYSLGMFRWQSPLISSWQLSGLGRWALPMLLLPLLARGIGKAVLAAYLPMAAIVAVALVRVEFRAAAFPLMGFMIWIIAMRPSLRGILAAGMFAYMGMAPFIFGNPAFLALVEPLVPEFAVRLSGATLENILSLTDRTTLWIAAVEDLKAGHNIWYGQGYFGLDASIFGVWDLGEIAVVVSKFSFHQGFLDLCFVFGGAWAFFLLLGVGLSFRTVLQPTATMSPRSLGWLSLGMIGLSNCHDGFFTPNFIFLTLMLFSVVCAGSESTNHQIVPDGLHHRP